MRPDVTMPGDDARGGALRVPLRRPGRRVRAAVRQPRAAAQHPVVGELDLTYEVMELAADGGLRLAIFSAEPGSRS